MPYGPVNNCQGKENHLSPSCPLGSRTVIAGQTGCGKTTLATWLLSQTANHWIIFNPKWSDSFKKALGEECNVLRTVEPKAISNSIEKFKFTVINIPPEFADPEQQDLLIKYVHETYRDVGVLVDELYTVHKHGNAGPGLIGLLTRGREFRQTFLGLTQRPAWVSRFVFSESGQYGIMRLTMPDDRKKVFEFIGDSQYLIKVAKYKVKWYSVEDDTTRNFSLRK